MQKAINTKGIRNLRLLLLTCVCGGLFSTVKGELTLVDTYKSTPENTDHIVSFASALLGAPDLTSLFRVEDLSPAPAGSPFSITYPSSNIADISWDLSGSGFDLFGVYIFGGSNGANLYKITDSAQLI